MDNLSGQQIKGYELQERIAAGGFGAVYRAHQSTVGREVAVKVILPGLANQPDFIRRFEAEAQLIARLEHHFIVPLYDYWRDPDGAYLVMRYLRGGSLHDHIRRQGALSIEEAFNLFSQVAEALHVAHRNNIIHCDIKPGNILLDEDGTGFLADFGIAKDHTIAQGITEPDSLIGSPEYLAPEQARSEPVTPQTDIYSLGVILYEMLVGEHPFPGLEKVTYIFKHLNDPLPEITALDDRIRDGVNDVIQKATAKDPQQRFTDVIAMMTALQQAAQLDIAPTPTSPVELLTPREQEVMQLIIDGKTNREIADVLVLTEGTIKTYITRIYRKLNVRSRVQAITRARELNFVIQKPETTTIIGTAHLPEPENPYKGLRAFQAADAQDFFGRENFIQKLLRRLQENGDYHRFLSLVGPSGSGKSSVVKAGLIPALWRGDLPGSENWYIVDFLPGHRPLDELEITLLRVAGDNKLDLREQLERDEYGLLRVANLILPDDGSELLIVIDQFEEVFTLLENDDEHLHFLNLIRAAVTDKRSRVRVVVTLRADYYDRPLQYPDFGELIRNRVETVLPLGAEELERAISEPANRAGVHFEDGLVAQIVTDVHYQPGALPLLQYALTELFERRDGRKLTMEAYHAIGGTGGALAKRADEIYLEGDEASQESIRQLFLRLVTLGEGAEDSRRRVTHSELLQITADADMMDEIIDLYADSRLLSLDHDPATRRPTVEVAHEAILREWDRLRGWLNESRDDIRQERLIAQAAEAWQANNCDASYLLTGSRLEQAEIWFEQTELALTPLERDFIQTCIQEAKAQELAEAERQAREEAQERRSRTLFRALVAVFAVATILSGGFGLFALNQRNDALVARETAIVAQHEAELNADQNQRRALAFAARSALEQEQYDLALALGVESARDDVLLPETMRVLDRLAYSMGQRHNFGYSAPCPLKLSPDGRYVGFAVNDCSKLILWDMRTYDEIQQLTYPDGTFSEFEMSGNNQRLVGRVKTPNDDFIATWDVASGEMLGNKPARYAAVPRVIFARDSSTLSLLERTQTEIEEVPGGMGHIIVLRDAVTFEELQRYVFEDEFIYSVQFSLDGSLGITGGIAHLDGGGNARVLVFDTDTGEILQTFERENGSRFGAGTVGISPDNNTIWLSLSDGTRSYIIDRATGKDLHILDGWINRITPDFQSLAINGQWLNLDTGETRTLPRFMASESHTVGYDPATFLVSPETNLQLWDVYGRDRNDRIIFEHPSWNTATYSPDGQYIVTAGVNLRDPFGPAQPIYILEAATGTVVRELQGHSASVWGLDWSPDGRYIASGAWDDGVVIWDAETGEEIHRLMGIDDPLIFNIQFTPDSHYVLAANRWVSPMGGYETPPYLVMWDVESGELVHRIEIDREGVHDGIHAIAIHPDNKHAFVSIGDLKTGQSATHLVNLEAGEVIREFNLEGLHYFIAIVPDGQTAFTTGFINGDIIEFDIATGEILRTWQSPLDQTLNTIAISHDGRYLAMGSNFDSQEQAVSLWDQESGELIRRFLFSQDAFFLLKLEFSPDDSELMVTGDNGIVRIAPVDEVPALEWIQENRYIRDFTCPERELYRIEPYCEDE